MSLLPFLAPISAQKEQHLLLPSFLLHSKCFSEVFSSLFFYYASQFMCGEMKGRSFKISAKSISEWGFPLRRRGSNNCLSVGLSSTMIKRLFFASLRCSFSFLQFSMFFHLSPQTSIANKLLVENLSISSTCLPCSRDFCSLSACCKIAICLVPNATLFVLTPE